MDVSSNYLSGPIPEAWTPIVMGAHSLNFNYNYLSGSLPAGWSNSTPAAFTSPLNGW